MAKVYSRSLGRLIDVDEQQYQQALQKAGTLPTLPQTPQGGSQPSMFVPSNTPDQPPEIPNQSQTSVTNPWGVSLQELYQGKAKAIANNDTASAKQIQQFIDIEEKTGGSLLDRGKVETAKEPNEADKAAIETINALYGAYNAIPSSEKGTIVGSVTSRVGSLFPKASAYKDWRKAFAGSLKSLVGETGRLTDQDVLRILGAIPAVGEAEKSAEEKKRMAKDILESRGLPVPDALKDVGLPSEPPTLPGIVGGIAKTVGNIATPSLMDLPQEFNKQQLARRELAKNPEYQGMAKSPQQFMERLGGLAKADLPALTTAAKAGAEVAFAVDIAKSVPGITKSLSKMSRASLDKFIPTFRKADKLVAQGVKEAKVEKIAGKKMIEAIDQKAKALDAITKGKPTFVKFLKSAKSDFKKGLPVNQIQDFFIKYRGGFSKGGEPLKATEAAIRRIVRQAIREQAKEAGAEKVIKGIETAAKAKNLPKNLWKLLGRMSLISGGVAGSAYLYNLLTGKNSQGGY